MRAEGERGVVRIGNAHGRIALYLDDSEAIEIALHYGPSDMAYAEIMQAVEKAYPETAPQPPLARDPEWSPSECVCAETSTRNCPVHQNAGDPEWPNLPKEC